VESLISVMQDFDQDVTYNSFQKVSTITENDTTATFLYNADQQRAKMFIADNGTTILTRWYVRGSYMVETQARPRLQRGLYGLSFLTIPYLTTKWFNLNNPVFQPGGKKSFQKKRRSAAALSMHPRSLPAQMHKLITLLRLVCNEVVIVYRF